MPKKSKRSSGNKRLFNVRLEAYEYSLVQAAAAARGVTMTKLLRDILKAEVATILQAELNKNDDDKEIR